jgi:cell division protein FtsB
LAFFESLMLPKSRERVDRRRERVVLFVLVGILSVLVVYFGMALSKTHREFENFKARQDRIELRLIQARKEFAEKEAYLRRLMEDPDFLERVARERLGYSRPDELLFRFSEEL